MNSTFCILKVPRTYTGLLREPLFFGWTFFLGGGGGGSPNKERATYMDPLEGWFNFPCRTEAWDHWHRFPQRRRISTKMDPQTPEVFDMQPRYLDTVVVCYPYNFLWNKFWWTPSYFGVIMVALCYLSLVILFPWVETILDM